MKLKTISTLYFAASTMLVASSAMAWESEDGQHSTSASVALTSDYVWRGLTQTDEEAAISGSFDYSHASGFYIGTWASNIDFGSESSVEVDVYAGFGGDIADSGFSYDIGFLRYMYPSEGDINWNEYYGSLSYSFLTAFVGYTNEYGGSDNTDATYFDLSAAYDIEGTGISLAASVGRYDIDNADDYTNWKLGASTELAGFGVDVTYSDTNIDTGIDSSGRLVFTISKSM